MKQKILMIFLFSFSWFSFGQNVSAFTTCGPRTYTATVTSASNPGISFSLPSETPLEFPVCDGSKFDVTITFPTITNEYYFGVNGVIKDASITNQIIVTAQLPPVGGNDYLIPVDFYTKNSDGSRTQSPCGNMMVSFTINCPSCTNPGNIRFANGNPVNFSPCLNAGSNSFILLNTLGSHSVTNGTNISYEIKNGGTIVNSGTFAYNSTGNNITIPPSITSGTIIFRWNNNRCDAAVKFCSNAETPCPNTSVTFRDRRIGFPIRCVNSGGTYRINFSPNFTVPTFITYSDSQTGTTGTFTYNPSGVNYFTFPSGLVGNYTTLSFTWIQPDGRRCGVKTEVRICPSSRCDATMQILSDKSNFIAPRDCYKPGMYNLQVSNLNPPASTFTVSVDASGYSYTSFPYAYTGNNIVQLDIPTGVSTATITLKWGKCTKTMTIKVCPPPTDCCCESFELKKFNAYSSTGFLQNLIHNLQFVSKCNTTLEGIKVQLINYTENGTPVNNYLFVPFQATKNSVFLGSNLLTPTITSINFNPTTFNVGDVLDVFTFLNLNNSNANINLKFEVTFYFNNKQSCSKIFEANINKSNPILDYDLIQKKYNLQSISEIEKELQEKINSTPKN